MQFHPQKCQVLKITNKRNKINSTYKIHNTPLTETDSAKYLGITIDNKLTWKDHHTNTVRKANNTLAFIRRNLTNCPPHIKEQCHTTLVRPILEYGSAVWDPHHQKAIDKFEQINKRAARYVTGNYSYEPGSSKLNMEKLGWKPLEERRAIIKLHLFFKAKKKLLDIPLEHLKQNTRSGSRRPNTYAIPTSLVDSRLYSFYPSTIRLWNSLLADIKSSENCDTFKELLENSCVHKSKY